ncbi:uncharacterized protein LOC107261024 [Ricinus communis]|uniref:uncharacterized protein LOC107261024 n=1 Tax=Ricinus communis TaxID=3988 RepID=UPI000772B090|nr:uncharacterized protein LOC107261024 [Ricinus communis]|eukprot:XP_015572996.1 uncharacterized protein LOC107261024 [Ricinus communis]
MVEDANVLAHVLKMINLIEHLEVLNFSIDADLQTNLILQSLPDYFSTFIMNFHMNKIECTLAELLNQIMTAQGTMQGKGKETTLVFTSTSRTKSKKKARGRFAIKPTSKVFKARGKGTGKEVSNDKGKCFFCQKEGHWKCNCVEYLNP